MLKTEFVAQIASRYNINQAEAQKWLAAVLDSVEDGLARDGKLNLRGFGSFAVYEKKGRRGVHPQSGEPLDIPPARTVKFSPSDSFKSLVNDPLYEKIIKN
ncbi:MAG: HU family DNA-binding protein [Desulfovibrio sp.]|nr:HU family DNA-binding protein [Desulfovibrio sp.]